jgi:hypothetical protein
MLANHHPPWSAGEDQVDFDDDPHRTVDFHYARW